MNKRKKTGDFLSVIFQKKNNKGWIEIVEAFIAILLITGVLLIIITRSSPTRQDISERVYNSEITIIRSIQLNDTLRNSILSISQGSLPVEWDNPSFPQIIKNDITSLTPNDLSCTAKICDTSDSCFLSTNPSNDVYAQDGILSATEADKQFNPVKISVFCWSK